MRAQHRRSLQECYTNLLCRALKVIGQLSVRFVSCGSCRKEVRAERMALCILWRLVLVGASSVLSVLGLQVVNVLF